MKRRKIKTAFGYEGVFVYPPCMVIYAVSMWILDNISRIELEHANNVKIKSHSLGFYIIPENIGLVKYDFKRIPL